MILISGVFCLVTVAVTYGEIKDIKFAWMTKKDVYLYGLYNSRCYSPGPKARSKAECALFCAQSETCLSLYWLPTLHNCWLCDFTQSEEMTIGDPSTVGQVSTNLTALQHDVPTVVQKVLRKTPAGTYLGQFECVDTLIAFTMRFPSASSGLRLDPCTQSLCDIPADRHCDMAVSFDSQSNIYTVRPNGSTFFNSSGQMTCNTADGVWIQDGFVCAMWCQRNGTYQVEQSYYTGKVNKMLNGYPCQAWTSDAVVDNYANDKDHLFESDGYSVERASDYCRDPDKEGRVWCYNGQPNVNPPLRWEFCDVPLCP